MTGWINSLLGSVPTWSLYVAVFLLPFLEASVLLGLVVPGETALIFAGVLSSRGDLGIAAVLTLGIAGAILGDSTGYAVGRRFGPQIQLSRPGRLVGEGRWRASEDFLQRRGAYAVFLGRFTAVLRSLVPGAAGMARIPYLTFLVWNVIGGAVWATLSVYGGWVLGEAVGAYLSDLGYVVVAILVILLLVHAAMKLRRRRSRQQPDSPTAIEESAGPSVERDRV